ncbi:hypothetical protein D3C72_2180260 [compost metagenome]
MNIAGVKPSVMNTTRLPDVKRPPVMRGVSAEQIINQQVTSVVSGTAFDFMVALSLRKATFMHVLGLKTCNNSSSRSKK